MKKKLISLLIIALALTFSAVPIFANDQYVYDETGVLSDQELDSLNEKARQVREDEGVEFYFVLTNTDQDTATYAKEVFDQVKKTEDALLIMINMNQGSLATESSGWGSEYSTQTNVLTMVQVFNEAETYVAAIEGIYDVISNTTNYVDPEIPEEHLKPLFVDEVGLFSEKDANELNKLLSGYSDELKCDIAAVFVDSVGGQNINYAAADYYDYNGYGYGEYDDGILLFVAINDREYTTSTYGYGIHAFTDEGLIALEDAFINDLSNDDYYEAVIKYANKAHELIKSAQNGVVYGEAVQEEKSFFDVVRLGVAALIGTAAGLLTTGGMKKELNNVKAETGASQYVTENHFNLRNNYDFFTHRTTNRRRIERSSGGSSGGGGSRTTFRSSSGRVHGGRSGRF